MACPGVAVKRYLGGDPGPGHMGVAPAEGQGAGRVNTGCAARTPQFLAGPTARAPSLGTARQPGRRQPRQLGQRRWRWREPERSAPRRLNGDRAR